MRYIKENLIITGTILPVIFLLLTAGCSSEKQNIYTSLDEAIENKSDVCTLLLNSQELNHFPDEILEFSNLEYLDLSQNEIEMIPEGIKELSNLKTLIIDRNRFKTLPQELKNLNLKKLNISDNRYLREPVFIYKIKSLEELSMAGLGWEYNKRDSLYTINFKGIENLTHLISLDISGYTWRVADFPVEICQLINLRKLNISDNWYNKIPSEILNLKNLRILDISSFGDKLHNVEIVLQLPKLSHLLMKYNTPSFESKHLQVGCKNTLQNLDMSFCNLNSLPGFLFQFNNLTYLNIEGNKLSRLQEELSGLNNLKTLIAGQNPYKKFPDVINKLKKLETLQLNGFYAVCGYNEPVFRAQDVDFSGLLSLQTIDLSDNQLDKLPKGLEGVVTLKKLYLANNRFNSNEILKKISNLSKLEELNLSANGIKQLPDGFANLKSLKKLIIANRYCEGVPVGEGFDILPVVICKLESLEELVLPGHQIEKIPESIANLKALKTLILSDNKLHGKFPAELINLHNIEAIDLYIYCVGETSKYCTQPYVLDERICNLSKLEFLSFVGQPDSLMLMKIKNCLSGLDCQYETFYDSDYN